jgi:hypothetical protein
VVADFLHQAKYSRAFVLSSFGSGADETRRTSLYWPEDVLRLNKRRRDAPSALK